MMNQLIDNSKTDKNTDHSYLPTYEKLFSRLKNTTGNLLEIGVRDGGSVKLWSDYFTKATVHGADVVESPEWLRNYDRVKLYTANAYDDNFIANELQSFQFDLIIDDGSHALNDMIFVAKNYSKLLSPTGILVIEDIQSMDWVKPIINAVPPNLRSSVYVIDLRKNKRRWDDVLIVLDKSK